MKRIERRVNVAYFVAAVALSLSLYSAFVGRSVPTASAQNDMYLSRRIDQVEQRFYTLESRLNRLESARPPISTSMVPNTNDTEMQFLRTQIDGLRTRVGELECGLLKLDERTLASGRRIAARTAEPCRKDTSGAIQLSARPN